MFNLRNPLSQQIHERLVAPSERGRYYPDEAIAVRPFGDPSGRTGQSQPPWWNFIGRLYQSIAAAIDPVGLKNDDVLVDLYLRTPHGTKVIPNARLAVNNMGILNRASIENGLDQGQALFVSVIFEGGHVVKVTPVNWKFEQLTPYQTAVAASTWSKGSSSADNWNPNTFLPSPTTARFAPVPTNPMSSWASRINKVAAIIHLDPNLLAAWAYAESGGDPNATSSVGARGLMQIMPGTYVEQYKKFAAAHPGVKLIDDPDNPDTSLFLGAFYGKGLIDTFSNKPDCYSLAIAAYNAGPGAVQAYHGIPPYPQTQAYVKRVLAHWGVFQATSIRAALHPFDQRFEVQQQNRTQAHLQSSYGAIHGGSVR